MHIVVDQIDGYSKMVLEAINIILLEIFSWERLDKHCDDCLSGHQNFIQIFYFYYGSCMSHVLISLTENVCYSWTHWPDMEALNRMSFKYLYMTYFWSWYNSQRSRSYSSFLNLWSLLRFILHVHKPVKLGLHKYIFIGKEHSSVTGLEQNRSSRCWTRSCCPGDWRGRCAHNLKDSMSNGCVSCIGACSFTGWPLFT